ncbi:MAG TPA: type I secretion C-terminal target domain-containing protein, partial [Castellaniella sp.]|nr:type I secretion C-terminal target domain-containing protein [Castellaniella sp.]
VSYTGPNGGGGQLISQVSNNLEGVVFGDGRTPQLADPAATTFQTVPAVADDGPSYLLDLQAAVSDPDGSEYLGDLVLAGIPEGAAVSIQGDAPDGLSLVLIDGQWVLHWDDAVGPDARQSVDLTLQITDVPATVDFQGVQVQVDSHEINGSAASASADAILSPAGDGGNTGGDAGEGDGEGDDSSGGSDGSGDAGDEGVPGAAGDFSHSGTDLLVNGDFSQFQNTTQWWSGNNDQGYTAWTSTGPFLDDADMMSNGRDGGPYVGAWNNDGRDITLTQNLSGVPAGSVLQMEIAWNNPNRGDLNDPYNYPLSTGNSTRFEISYGGVVYAVISTPVAGESVANASHATVTAMNGARVNIDQIQTWSQDYDKSHGDDGFRPQNLTGFETLQIQLPVDAPASGQLSLHWDPQSDGDAYGLADDLMVANVHLYAADPIADILPSMVDADDEGVVVPDGDPDNAADGNTGTGQGSSSNQASQGGEDDDPAQPQGDPDHVLAGTSGNDVFQWALSDGGPQVTHDLIQNFGVGDEGRGLDSLDLRDLLLGEQNGDLTQYLHFSTTLNEQGVADTVIHIQTHGALGADGSGYNHQITLENVDLVGSITDQGQLIQNLIQEGKLKVDQ